MLDFGFPELLMIMAVAILVIGPNEIPKVMYGLGRLLRRLQYMRYAITQQFDSFMDQSDLADIHKQVNFEAPEGGFDEAAEDEAFIASLAQSETPCSVDQNASELKDMQESDDE